jgi:Arc/MetJ family transcription regulator
MEITMSASANNQITIWLGDTDPDGNPLHEDVKTVAYEKVHEMTRYRSRELSDKAEVSLLFEEAAYRTSKAASKSEISDLAAYLWRTYKNLVDQTLGRAVKLYGVEEEMLAQIAEQKFETEEALIDHLTCQKFLALMDSSGRDLWVRRITGFSIKEIATQENQNSEYLGKRLRRAIERALRRLTSERRAGDNANESLDGK